MKRNAQEEVEYYDMSTNRESDPVIDIHFCGSTPLVWRAAQVKTTRDEGVIGTLVGSLARQPRQNGRLGRPLELTQEEGRLLVEMGRAAVTPAEDVDEEVKSSTELVERYQAALESSYDQQRVMALDDRKTVMLKVMTEKLKRDSGSEDAEKALSDRVDALTDGFSFARSAMTVQLHTARLGLAHCPEEHSFLKVDWPMPLDEGSKARFCVFRDLRRQGFYLTSAGKFGGDYLVYPGDPLRFHSHFIAVCVSMDKTMPPCDILAIARLGSNVKKTVLLCSPVEGDKGHGTQRVLYTSLQWSGMV